MKRVFKLLTICCFVISIGCQKEVPPVDQVPDHVDTTTNLPQTPDSVLILTKVTSSYGMNLSLAYDLEHKRYSSWSETYPVYYDSTLIFYNAQGNVSGLVRKYGTIGDAFEVYPSFFVYNSLGLASKIFRKRSLSSTSYDYYDGYSTTLTDSLDFNYVEAYDSINYNSQNKVASIYIIGLDRVSHTYQLGRYQLVQYQSYNDSLLSSVVTYTLNSNNAYDSTTLKFRSYINKINPYYKPFGSLVFLAGGMPFASRLPTVPNNFDNEIDQYLTSNPYLCTSFFSPAPELTYSFNADSLVTSCIPGQNTMDAINFIYTRMKK